ncbi:5-keto-D-gluconate 5-reductase [Paenibacillus plantiphilus]|uniref:5-keto-D-gluconate 5-reductase n=1 Tax=Paenibacillus plantiphilus TaxID=2905650 RepID=A0ABN8G4E4_9BACL|nr:SDR family oxidoreductase [Paenibacillus plantiphilus]CAH1199277.1 5-keto-D-gluconate 5-reductase [Paenibacillus plantiphilus]
MTAKVKVQQLFDLTGKVALVTGGNNLGYDAAETLAELGAIVVITRREQEAAARTAAQLAQETGAEVAGAALEVTDEASWKAVVEDIVAKYGRIDILINNAGGRKVSVIPETVEDDPSFEFLETRLLEDWKYTMDANLTSVFLGCRTVAPHMKGARSGKIINMASIDGIVGRDLRIYPGSGLSPTVPDYLASKAGVINLTKGIGVSLAPFGIYVNAISPGGFYREQPDKFVENYTRLVPLGRMGRDRIDLKGSIAYLASSASDYTVGHNLVIDGGLTSW